MTDATAGPVPGSSSTRCRDAGDDLLTMVPKLGAMGYDGVELYGGQLTGLDPAEVLDVLGAAGMTVSSAHVGLGPDGTVDEAELDRLQAIGVDTVINPMIPELPDPGAVAATAEQFAAAAAQLRHRGVTFGYHNHFWELSRSTTAVLASCTSTSSSTRRSSPRSTSTGRRSAAPMPPRSSPSSATACASST